MKRYLVFTGSFYFPRGGWLAFKADFEHILEAEESALALKNSEWYHIFDTELERIVADGQLTWNGERQDRKLNRSSYQMEIV